MRAGARAPARVLTGALAGQFSFHVLDPLLSQFVESSLRLEIGAQRRHYNPPPAK
jgi:hypothetical protein